MHTCLLSVSVLLFINFVSATPSTKDDRGNIEDADFWIKSAQDNLRRVLGMKESSAPTAKNIVVLIGDGMGMTTITASRIYKGQKTKESSTGEGYSLSFDKFPNVGLSKTYNVDKQVPDSAGTATAMFSGVKTRYAMLGMDARTHTEQYEGPAAFEKSKLTSIMDWAQAAGKRTGFVTTTRVTHATPAALYCHTPFRDWECDQSLPEDLRKTDAVKDIARQLVDDAPGNKLNVILAGGSDMMGNTHSMPKDSTCQRDDGRDLVAEWLNSRSALRSQGIFVNTTVGLERAKVHDIDYLMGLFAFDHLPYNAVRDKGPNGTPSLALMTKQALGILQRPDQGFVLMVEGGRIDHAHHKNYAQLALDEASEFDEAVKVVLENTNADETLIIVTADHSHAFTINGYPTRNNDILGFANETKNETVYETLTYANGPGYLYHRLNDTHDNRTWRDLENSSERNSPYYQHLATMYLVDETHGGEDVPVYATGPCSHLIRGVFEQNYIGHVMSYAGCMGPSASLNPACNDSCTRNRKLCKRSSASTNVINLTLLISISLLFLISQRMFS